MSMFILKEGATGQEVKRFQKNLNTSVDGVFGPKTKEALKQYQRNNNISADGIYGPVTQEKMHTEVFEGIDVSHHNGVIDWKKVKETENKFAFIKLSEGRTYKDPKAKYNWEQAKKNGLLVGGYHFARPDTDVGIVDAALEAKHFCEQLKALSWQKDKDFVPVLDLEAGMKTSDQYNADWAVLFCLEVAEILAVKPIVYTAKWYFDSYLLEAKKETLEKLYKYPVWWAHYTTDFQNDPNIKGWTSWNMWQWTGSAVCSGINSKVDKNLLPGGYEGLNKLIRG